MGLDIIAYRKLKKNERLSNLSNDKKEYIDIDCLIMSPYLAGVDEAFPGRAEPLKYNGDVYVGDECKNINIGSYGTYGWFRQALETFSKDNDYFNELIDFSDCEGVRLGNGFVKITQHLRVGYYCGCTTNLNPLLKLRKMEVR